MEPEICGAEGSGGSEPGGAGDPAADGTKRPDAATGKEFFVRRLLHSQAASPTLPACGRAPGCCGGDFLSGEMKLHGRPGELGARAHPRDEVRRDVPGEALPDPRDAPGRFFGPSAPSGKEASLLGLPKRAPGASAFKTGFSRRTPQRSSSARRRFSEARAGGASPRMSGNLPESSACAGSRIRPLPRNTSLRPQEACAHRRPAPFVRAARSSRSFPPGARLPAPAEPLPAVRAGARTAARMNERSAHNRQRCRPLVRD